MGRRKDINDIRNEFEKHGIMLLDCQIYKSNKQKLKFICLSHLNANVQEMSYDHFQSKKVKGCKFCGIDFRAKEQKKDYTEIKEFVESIGYTLLSNLEEYKNIKTILKILCDKHGEIEISYSNLYTRKRCPKCGFDLQSGENHHSWNGGITESRKHLREKLSQWKLDSMKNCDFCCVITGEKIFEIHHLQGFDLILIEALNNLKLTLKDKIKDYDSESLTLLESEVINLHYKYPLGVCLKKDIHTLFHKLYGYGKNTPEQFYEFKIN